MSERAWDLDWVRATWCTIPWSSHDHHDHDREITWSPEARVRNTGGKYTCRSARGGPHKRPIPSSWATAKVSKMLSRSVDHRQPIVLPNTCYRLSSTPSSAGTGGILYLTLVASFKNGSFKWTYQIYSYACRPDISRIDWTPVERRHFEYLWEIMRCWHQNTNTSYVK